MKKNEQYKGENESLIEFNKRIVIERDGKPYLIRRTLLTIWKLISFKYHTILQSDDVCSHDHPWPFITIILKGGYYEWTPVEQEDSGKYVKNRVGVDGVLEICHWHGAGSIMYRPAKWRHQLELKELTHQVFESNGNLTVNEISPIVVPAKTFVITFRVLRDWGFFTRNGWVFWKNYDKAKHC